MELGVQAPIACILLRGGTAWRRGLRRLCGWEHRQALIFLLLFGSSQKVKISITGFYNLQDFSKTNNFIFIRNLFCAFLLFQ
jgi:hypothetical protein